MKYVHLVESFSTGVFSWIQDVACHQANQGHEVVIVHSLREETPEDYEELFPKEIRFIHLPMKREINPVRDGQSILHITKLLRALEPDVLHLHSSKAGVLGRVAAVFSRTKASVFYTPHGLAHLRQDVSRFKQGLFRFIEGATSRLPGRVLACSAGEYESLEYVIPGDNLTRVDNAIDSRVLADEFPRIKKDTTSVTICTLGGVRYQKAPWMFAEIAARLGDSLAGIDIKWKWIGDGDQEFVEELIKSGVEVTGWMPRKEALATINECDIYLQTSLWEGLSLSVLEAQCLGLPAVISDCIGNREAISVAHTGYVARNTEEFLQALSRLILDRSERRFLSINARKWVQERYSLQRLLAELDAVYAGGVLTEKDKDYFLKLGSETLLGCQEHAAGK